MLADNPPDCVIRKEVAGKLLKWLVANICISSLKDAQKMLRSWAIEVYCTKDIETNLPARSSNMHIKQLERVKLYS